MGKSINSKSIVFHMRASNFYGGPERQILEHIKINKNFDLRILTFVEGGEKNELIEKCELENIPFHSISVSSSFDIKTILKMRKLFKKYKPAILCSHGYKPTILSLIAKIGLNIPLIVFSRGHTNENYKVSLFETLELKATKFVSDIIAVSEGYSSFLIKKGIPKKKISVVQNAINIRDMDLDDITPGLKREELGFEKNDFLIATAGRLSPEKAQADLIHAFSKISNKFPKAKLLIIGDGPLYKDFETLIAQNNIENVYLLGFRKDIYEIMSSIDLFVLPSLTEGLPNVILEAFAYKKPVVATKVGGVPEVVDHGINGLIVSPGNYEELSEAIEKMIENPNLLEKMGNSGFQKVKNNFSMESQNEKLNKIYNRIINKKKILEI